MSKKNKYKSYFSAGEINSKSYLKKHLKIIGAKLRFYFFSGLIFLLPFVVTIWVLYQLFNIADSGFLAEPIKDLVGFRIPGLNIIITSLLIIIAGVVAEKAGQGLYSFLESFFMKIPIARWIISTTRQVSNFLVGKKRMIFRKAVLVEYPKTGIYSLGFEIVSAPEELNKKTGQELVSVFIPTTPNPTSGMLVFLPNKDITELDISVDVAMKMIISGAIIASNEN